MLIYLTISQSLYLYATDDHNVAYGDSDGGVSFCSGSYVHDDVNTERVGWLGKS